MQPFIHKIPFFETFPTSLGNIEVFAGVEISGSKLRLYSIAIAAAALEPAAPGRSILRGIADQIEGAALTQGFESIEFEGERLTGVRKYRENRMTRLSRRLR